MRNNFFVSLFAWKENNSYSKEIEKFDLLDDDKLIEKIEIIDEPIIRNAFLKEIYLFQTNQSLFEVDKLWIKYLDLSKKYNN